MTANVNEWTPALAYIELRDHLRDTISVANGFNTSPQVFDAYVADDMVPPGACPYLCCELVYISDRTTTLGSDSDFESLTEDVSVGVIVWGGIEDEHNRDVAALALIQDVLAAVWRRDSAGLAASVMTNLLRADVAQLSQSTPPRALVAIQLELHVQFDRETV